MSFEDRDYYRQGRVSAGGWPGFGDMRRLLMFLLLGTIPFGRVFGIRIRIRIHMMFVWLVVFQTLLSGDPVWALRWTSLLFVGVLLHEFGHCFGCRSVGGQADEILMWPLGGLAMCAPPRTPWAEFVTVACGPLVSLVLAAVPYTVLLVWFGENTPVSLNPIEMWRLGWHDGLAGLLRDMYLVNYTLLLFNLLMAFYPFDGGRLVQVAIWKATNYATSVRWSTAVGMAGAGAAALFGVLYGQFFLILLGIFGFLVCYRQMQAVAAYGADPGYDVGYYDARQREPGGRQGKRQAKRRERQQKQRAAQEAELDRVLAKVKAEGLHSLTRKEKKVLQQATDSRRDAG